MTYAVNNTQMHVHKMMFDIYIYIHTYIYIYTHTRTRAHTHTNHTHTRQWYMFGCEPATSWDLYTFCSGRNRWCKLGVLWCRYPWESCRVSAKMMGTYMLLAMIKKTLWSRHTCSRYANTYNVSVKNALGMHVLHPYKHFCQTARKSDQFDSSLGRPPNNSLQLGERDWSSSLRTYDLQAWGQSWGSAAVTKIEQICTAKRHTISQCLQAKCQKRCSFIAVHVNKITINLSRFVTF